MSDTINFASWETMKPILENNNALVSGMTMAEAESALGTQVASNGFRLVGQVTQNGANAVTNFPNVSSALEGFESFESSGGAIAQSGAAVVGTGAVGAGTIGLANISGTTSVVGVATGTAGVCCAAAAPIFGVALGAGLYEIAPSFWEDVSRTLLPFVWDDIDAMPIVYDALGNTYMSQDAIRALETLLENTNIAKCHVDGLSEDIKFLQGTTCYKYDNGGIVKVYDSPNAQASTLYVQLATNHITNLIASENELRYSYTKNGKTVYYAYGNDVGDYYGQNTKLLPHCTVLDNNEISIEDVAWYMIYGNINPAITDVWRGDTYPSNPNTIELLTGYDANNNPVYEKYQQVAMPIGDPLVTNDPEIQGSPYTNPEISPAIDPYISPYPSPELFPQNIPEIVPNYKPAPLPSVEIVPDPNAQTEALPSPQINPATENDPAPNNPPQPSLTQSSGTSITPSLPLVPLIPTSGDASLFHVYNPTVAQMDSFGSWLWQSFLGALFDDISRLFNNPMDAVIGLQEFYGTPNISGVGNIRCGYLDSGIQSNIVGSRYSAINCGTIIIPEYYGNYLDYAPYTQVFIYLPFIGVMSLNADDIIGNAVNVTYNLDSWTGSCIAIITVARQGYSAVVYQFEGNCSVDIPLTGGQQTALKGAIIGGISGAVMGGIPGAVVGAITGGLASKNDVQHSGSFSASHGAMGAKIPFIIVRRPEQKKVANYSESYGYPAHKMVFIGNCRGYLRAKEVRVLSTTATNEEKELIVQALKQGVYVKN